MALKVSLKTPNTEESYLVMDPMHVNPISRRGKNYGFYDPVTGTNLTPDNLESEDLSSYINTYMSDGKTPKLHVIGRAIQSGLLYVSESDPPFPAVAMTGPLMSTHLLGGLCVVPGHGSLSGKWYEIFMTPSGISGTLYNPTSMVDLWSTVDQYQAIDGTYYPE